MKITGTIKLANEEQSGEGRNGPWRRREYIMETSGSYPKAVALQVWNENIDQFALQPGEEVVAHIDIQSRESKGKWFTDVKIWKVERVGPTPEREPALSQPDDDLPW